MIYVMRKTDSEGQSNYTEPFDHADQSDHAEAIRNAVACMNKELSEAVITAIETENPVDGYRLAVEMIEDTFEDMDAGMIEELFKSSVLRILRARVEGLMSDARCGKHRYSGKHTDSRSDGRRGEDTKWQDKGCRVSGCDPDEYLTCEYTRGI